MNRRAFSLMELIVSIAIIALLAGILIPTLSSARKRARSVACLSNMRQIGMAALMYAQENNDFFPRSSHSALAYAAMPWGYALSPFLGYGHYSGPGSSWNKLFYGVYRCPEDRRPERWSYGKNVWFELSAGETGEIDGVASGQTYHKVLRIPNGGATILFGELGSGSMADHIMAHFWYLGGSPEVDSLRHGAASNYGFVDGHAETRVFKTTFDTPVIDLWHPGRAR